LVALQTIADISGNPMGTDYISEFRVYDQDSDITPPRVVSLVPVNRGFVSPQTELKAFFSERVKLSTLTEGTFNLTAAGPDYRFGTSDDYLLTGGVIDYDEVNFSASLRLGSPLKDGQYRLEVRRAVSDLAGNMLEADARSEFYCFVVPEPSTLILAGGGFLLCLRRRRSEKA
jgi:hypothetical protein